MAAVVAILEMDLTYLKDNICGTVQDVIGRTEGRESDTGPSQ